MPKPLSTRDKEQRVMLVGPDPSTGGKKSYWPKRDDLGRSSPTHTCKDCGLPGLWSLTDQGDPKMLEWEPAKLYSRAVLHVETERHREAYQRLKRERYKAEREARLAHQSQSRQEQRTKDKKTARQRELSKLLSPFLEMHD